MNRYTTLGFRESFLEHFFDLGNDCWSSKELGNLQYASLKVWLKEAEIIEVNPQTDKNGQITELGKKLRELGIYHPMTWAVIWTNLSYNSSLIKWYLLCVNCGEVYEKGDFVFLIGDDYSERQRENAVSSLCETLGKSPIGNTLEMGVPIPNGKSYKYYKKAADAGNAKALNEIGVMYINGYFVEKNVETGKEYYQKAVNGGNKVAAANLGYFALKDKNLYYFL